MKNKGFTLIELLAVIVILGIIMVIAIPNVLDVLQSAKEKTFLEYTEKIYKKALEEFERNEMKNLVKKNGLYVYGIREDLSDGNSGSYGGYVIIDKDGNDLVVYEYVWDDDYFIGFVPSEEGIPTVNTKIESNTGSINYHVWNVVGQSYILNREDVQTTYFGGINFDDFSTSTVMCFIQKYWTPWNGQTSCEQDNVYYKTADNVLGTRVAIANSATVVTCDADGTVHLPDGVCTY